MSKATMMFCYFAYGSNMLTERLKARCDRARPSGCAFADGWVMEFSKPSKDCSGKASLSRKAGCETAGVLFEIPMTQRDALDEAEGATLRGGYRRCDAFPVRLVGGDGTITASTYLATKTDRSLKPYDWYLALVIAGAREHGLGTACNASLLRTVPMPDPVEGRKTRVEAIEALKNAGFPDYRELLLQR